MVGGKGFSALQLQQKKTDPRQKKSVGCCLVSPRFLIDSVNRMMDLFPIAMYL